jgi:hypothetical protein
MSAISEILKDANEINDFAYSHHDIRTHTLEILTHGFYWREEYDVTENDENLRCQGLWPWWNITHLNVLRTENFSIKFKNFLIWINSCIWLSITWVPLQDTRNVKLLITYKMVKCCLLEVYMDSIITQFLTEMPQLNIHQRQGFDYRNQFISGWWVEFRN